MITSLHPTVQLIVLSLAVARIVILLVDDAILDVLRGKLRAKLPEGGHLEILVTCYRCLGFWVALAGAISWGLWPVGTTILAVPWAIAMVQVLVNLRVFTEEKE